MNHLSIYIIEKENPVLKNCVGIKNFNLKFQFEIFAYVCNYVIYPWWASPIAFIPHHIYVIMHKKLQFRKIDFSQKSAGHMTSIFLITNLFFITNLMI